MTFYGVVSKGCQRCRQRKIKCDQQKPGCLKCEKVKSPCPGYRNLQDIIFRHESERVIRKARRLETEGKIEPTDTLSTPIPSAYFACSPGLQSGSVPITSLPFTDIPNSLSQPLNELGANFFFANYASNDGKLVGDYHVWLSSSYHDDSNHILRAVIAAVGMAGISNVFHAPHIASQAREKYCCALMAMNHALSDPVKMIADTTLMAVILFGMFETVTFETWGHFRSWVAHVEGATTLLELRGEEQFNRERGEHLFIQLRLQVLYACIQQNIAVPPALLRMSAIFRTIAIRQQRPNRSSRGFLAGMTFQVVNLRAAISNGDIVNPQAICTIAREIDENLEAWSKGVPVSWRFTESEIDPRQAAGGGQYFGGKRHVYCDLRNAEEWNSWRTLRIIANQIIVCHDIGTIGLRGALNLIRPLYIVSREKSNATKVRRFAAERLDHINTSMGIREAGLLAGTALQDLRESM